MNENKGCNVEWCSNCGDEVMLQQHLNKQVCPTCQSAIINCTYCMQYLGNECTKAVKCGDNK